MSFLSRNNSLSILAATFFSVFLCVSEGQAMSKVGGDTAIANPNFSPDGEALVFKECPHAQKCGVGFLDIMTSERRFIAPPVGREFSEPSFSPDGQSIVVVSHETPVQTQLAIMDIDGGNYREITAGRGCRSAPSFSQNGNKLIFVYSPLPETLSAKKCVEQDIYEMNASTGEIKQLTHYKFYSAGSPHFLPDGKSFIFYGDGPTAVMEPGEYEKQHGKNYIFIMDGKANSLNPAISGYEYSRNPSISRDGSIAFLVRTNKLDGLKSPYNYDIFIRNGSHDKRLTALKAAVSAPVISSDGSKVAFQADRERNGMYEMMIINADGSGLRSLGIVGQLF